MLLQSVDLLSTWRCCGHYPSQLFAALSWRASYFLVLRMAGLDMRFPLANEILVKLTWVISGQKK